MKYHINLIDKDIIQFTFEKDESEFPINITVLTEEDSAIIIDVGYYEYAMIVKDYLANKGIKTYIIFISHHHEDHFDGCKAFSGSQIFGSNLFKNDYQTHLEEDSILKNFEPNNYLVDATFFQTKKFNIEIIYTPGHNQCGFSFYINNKYLYVGDLIFYNKINIPSIPYLDSHSTVIDYIASLQKLMNLDIKYLLLGHGSYIQEEHKIQRQLYESLFYLRSIKNLEKKLSKCLLVDSTNYCGLKFHESNLKRIK